MARRIETSRPKPSFTRVLLGELVGGRGASQQTRSDSYESLSEREKQVLRLVALGYTNKQIANRLYLSVKTVETYRARVMEKLHLKTRAALVRYSLQKGLLDISEQGSSDE